MWTSLARYRTVVRTGRWPDPSVVRTSAKSLFFGFVMLKSAAWLPCSVGFSIGPRRDQVVDLDLAALHFTLNWDKDAEGCFTERAYDQQRRIIASLGFGFLFLTSILHTPYVVLAGHLIYLQASYFTHVYIAYAILPQHCLSTLIHCALYLVHSINQPPFYIYRIHHERTPGCCSY